MDTLMAIPMALHSRKCRRSSSGRKKDMEALAVSPGIWSTTICDSTSPSLSPLMQACLRVPREAGLTYHGSANSSNPGRRLRYQEASAKDSNRTKSDSAPEY